MKLTQTIKHASLALASVGIISLTAVAADEKAKADNTATNQRDRSGETNTSGDQSNSSADLKITAGRTPRADEGQRAFEHCQEHQSHHC